jgi:hypothetical protein
MIAPLCNATASQLCDLVISSEYAEYIMTNSTGERLICNGDTLLAAQEDGYLFDEFLLSIGLR